MTIAATEKMACSLLKLLVFHTSFRSPSVFERQSLSSQLLWRTKERCRRRTQHDASETICYLGHFWSHVWKQSLVRMFPPCHPRKTKCVKFLAKDGMPTICVLRRSIQDEGSFLRCVHFQRRNASRPFCLGCPYSLFVQMVNVGVPSGPFAWSLAGKKQFPPRFPIWN